MAIKHIHQTYKSAGVKRLLPGMVNTVFYYLYAQWSFQNIPSPKILKYTNKNALTFLFAKTEPYMKFPKIQCFYPNFMDFS